MKREYCAIYAQMHLIFDNDFDVFSISERVSLEPSDCRSRRDTRISPLTHEYNPGYWTLETEEKNEQDLKAVLDDLLTKISGKVEAIKKICEENGGIVKFDVVPAFSAKRKPALYFERDFLDIVHFLNATVEIDMSVW